MNKVTVNNYFKVCRPDAPVNLTGRTADVIRQLENGEYLIKLHAKVARGVRLQYVLPREALDDIEEPDPERLDVNFTLRTDGGVDLHAFGRRFGIPKPILNQSKFLLRLCTLREETKDVKQPANISKVLFSALTGYEAGQDLVRIVGDTLSPVGNYKRAIHAHS
jgi:hypothetical protein